MNSGYWSLGGLLEDLRILFPPALLGSFGWDRLRPLTNRLPVCAAESRFGFEFHLSDPDPDADFFVISAPGTPLAEYFLRLSEKAAAGLVGPNFAAFLGEQVNRPDSFLVRTGKGLILEYDLAGSPPGQFGAPGVFIVSGGKVEPDPLELHEDPAGLVATLRSAAGWRPVATESCLVKRTCAALADSGVFVSHAGVMPSRAGRFIRLVALGADPSRVTAGLEAIQWPGDPRRAEAILAAFKGLVSRHCGLGISVTPEGVLPRLDLELTRIRAPGSPTRESFRLDRPGWKLPIDRLVERGWCLPAKADGLRQWPNLEMFFGRDGLYQVRQIINHFKVVVDRDSVFAKAYAGMDVRRMGR